MPTDIPYVDETLNPWVGCTKIRAGCVNCYAERCDYRLAAMGQENYKKVLDGRKWNGKIAYQLDQLEKLKHWHKPRRVFMGSMTDIFHEKVPFCEIVRVFDGMYENTQHTYLITTKRPDRALEFAKWLFYDSRKWADHIWQGISCSTQKDLDEMAPILFQIPAAHYWLSGEPLLEDLRDHCNAMFPGDPSMATGWVWSEFDWVVLGAESGPGRRPCDIKWVRSVARQVKEADTALYVKQLDIDGKVLKDPKFFPEDLQIREMLK